MEDTTRRAVMIVRVFAIVLLCATGASAQSAEDWMLDADRAAREDRHDVAIAAYERAIQIDPALARELRPRLGRQHLWAGNTSEAVALLAGHVEENPGDCDVRNDYALALAWADRLLEARRQYREVIDSCPEQRLTALLRDALILRWLDRPTGATRQYERVLSLSKGAEHRDAEVGLGFVQLMRDQNRAARDRFLGLYDSFVPDMSAEGLALALYRLGRVAEAGDVVRSIESRGTLSRDMRELHEAIRSHDSWQVRGASSAFHDGDGTDFAALESGVSLGWGLRGRGEVSAGSSRLENDDLAIDAHWLELGGEHRWNESNAGRARLRRTRHDTGWDPWSGELHWIATPADGQRFDVAFARLLVSDNLAALENELRGDYLSAGTDRHFPSRFSLSASGDVTRWSTGNRRVRLHLSAGKILEGVPRLTLSWPTLVQFYDEPFDFGLWSPEHYVETGPAVNIYRRWKRVWNLSAYGRSGVQREQGSDWKLFGAARVAVERDLRNEWAMRMSAAWSNSNAAGSGGFRRTAIHVELLRRF